MIHLSAQKRSVGPPLKALNAGVNYQLVTQTAAISLVHSDEGNIQ